MEKNDSKVPPESKDSNGTEDISALINSVLEKLSNIVEQTTNAQQDMEKITNQMDMVQEKIIAPLESNDNDVLPESTDNSNDNNVLSKSNDHRAHPVSKDSNGTENSSASPVSDDNSGTDDISDLINSVAESLSNIAEEAARAQKEMESIKNLVEKDDSEKDDSEKDDNNDSFPDMPEPGAPGPGRPLPDFPSPYPDPQPDPFNDPKPGPFWEQNNSEK